jgi:hypothetical protein
MSKFGAGVKVLFRFRTLTCVLAAPNTVWFHNGYDTKYRIREDKIFALTRVYSRVARRYLWALVVGRLKFMFFPRAWW